MTHDEKARKLWDLTERIEQLQQEVRELMGSLDRQEEADDGK